MLEHQTELKPTQIMTETSAYSDVVFGLFSLLGYPFSPRLADIGGSRFGASSPRPITKSSTPSRSTGSACGASRRIGDDMLQLTGSLLLGRVPATGIMRILQVLTNPTRLAQGIAEFGRIGRFWIRFVDRLLVDGNARN